MSKVTSYSQRYRGRPFLYWWDVRDKRKEAIKESGGLVLEQEDTKRTTFIKAADLLPLLTEARRTSRSRRWDNKGNWGLRVRAGRPGEIEVEGAHGSKPAFIQVRWRG